MTDKIADKLDRETVQTVAALARLDLTPAEEELFATQLGQVLAYADRLQTVDTSNVPPTPYVIPLTNVIRDDDVTSGLTQQEALANAPDCQDGFFRVKAFFGT